MEKCIHSILHLLMFLYKTLGCIVTVKFVMITIMSKLDRAL